MRRCLADHRPLHPEGQFRITRSPGHRDRLRAGIPRRIPRHRLDRVRPDRQLACVPGVVQRAACGGNIGRVGFSQNSGGAGGRAARSGVVGREGVRAGTAGCQGWAGSGAAVGLRPSVVDVARSAGCFERERGLQTGDAQAVERIDAGPQADSRALHAYAIFDNADGALRPNLRGTLNIEIGGSDTPTIAVPVAAVLENNGVSFVFVREGNNFERREVQTGRKSGANIEILSGVLPEEDVVVQGNYQIQYLKPVAKPVTTQPAGK